MSRVANNPVTVPANVSVNLNGRTLTVKGGKGELDFTLSGLVDLDIEENRISVRALYPTPTRVKLFIKPSVTPATMLLTSARVVPAIASG